MNPKPGMLSTTCSSILSSHMVPGFYRPKPKTDFNTSEQHFYPVVPHTGLIQGSSNNSLAVFLFSGSHCNIDLMKFINSTLSSPSRFSSLESRLLDGSVGRRSGSFSSGSIHFPSSSKNSALRLPSLSKLSGGGPRTETRSWRWARVV
jgi:hypothetical protein